MYLNQQNVLSLLESHRAISEKEKQDTQKTINFVQSTAQFWQRETLPGHLTASAWIINATYHATILVHHKKLNLWFQPGGHIENDRHLLTAAKREAIEETGITPLDMISNKIFDIDVHSIPENKSVPQHLHFDIRFAFLADTAAQLQVSDESHDVRWISFEKLPEFNNDVSIARMAEKTRRLATIYKGTRDATGA